MSESLSERHGLHLITSDFEAILSIGISTAGSAEIEMASLAPNSQIIATTLDAAGAQSVKEELAQRGLDARIHVRIEDIAKVRPAADKLFDFVYARLVLHYLSEQDLYTALHNIYESMKPEAILYVVVRSENSPEAKQPGNAYDPATKLTTYEVASKGKYATRYFHSKESINRALIASGFTVDSVEEYDESLSPNFDRTGVPVQNNLIEVKARK